MSARPVVADLFAGEGGTGHGWHLAGWDVIGVEHKPARAKRNPHQVVIADALDWISHNHRRVQAVMAGPPCQLFTVGMATALQDATTAVDAHEDLLAPTRAACKATGLPYVIENVERAPLVAPMLLCGTMFGLEATDADGQRVRLERHRIFESNVLLRPPEKACRHTSTRVAGSYGGARADKREAREVRRGGYVPTKAVQAALLGIDWMTVAGLHQAIPPTYTRWIARQVKVLVDG